jgi:transcriptional regulator with XRE-family HTH domain
MGQNKKPRRQSGELPTLEEILLDVPLVSEILPKLNAERVDYDRIPGFVSGYLKASFVNDVCIAMRDQNLTKNGLAEKLGKSRQYVGRILNETANFTIESMAEIACSLDLRLSICLHAPGERVEVTRASVKQTPKSNGNRTGKRERPNTSNRRKRRATVKPTSRSRSTGKAVPTVRVAARHR